MNKLATIILAAALLCGPAVRADNSFHLNRKPAHTGFENTKFSVMREYGSRSAAPFLFPRPAFGLFQVESSSTIADFASSVEFKLNPELEYERKLFQRGILLFGFRREDLTNVLKIGDMTLERQYALLKDMIARKSRLVMPEIK